jgi:hypothetical protein
MTVTWERAALKAALQGQGWLRSPRIPSAVDVKGPGQARALRHVQRFC